FPVRHPETASLTIIEPIGLFALNVLRVQPRLRGVLGHGLDDGVGAHAGHAAPPFLSRAAAGRLATHLSISLSGHAVVFGPSFTGMGKPRNRIHRCNDVQFPTIPRAFKSRNRKNLCSLIATLIESCRDPCPHKHSVRSKWFIEDFLWSVIVFIVVSECI